jgi:hypothetical protein
LLDRDKARAIESCAASGDDRGLHRSPPFRILGAVLVAGKVEAGAIAERVDRLLEPERGPHRFFDAARAVGEFAAILASQPAPQRGGCRGYFEPRSRMARKNAQPGNLAAKRKHRRAPETDHGAVSIGKRTQRAQALGNVCIGCNSEQQMPRERRNRGEYSGLSFSHRDFRSS